jgi:hypothetical protein
MICFYDLYFVLYTSMAAFLGQDPNTHFSLPHVINAKYAVHVLSSFWTYTWKQYHYRYVHISCSMMQRIMQ